MIGFTKFCYRCRGTRKVTLHNGKEKQLVECPACKPEPEIDLDYYGYLGPFAP